MLMPNNTPLVSVIMGVRYRRDDLGLLKRSVESILNQSFKDFEFLICDGGSNEDAQRFLESYAKNDRRIVLIRDDCLSMDLAGKLNACLRAAGGRYIARMDDDDYSHPDRFEQQLAFLRQHPEMAFVGCNVELYADNERVGDRCFPGYPQVEDFYFTQPFIHPALMFRSEALVAVDGYSEDKRQILCEDYDLLLRLYSAGFCGANIQHYLLDYTVSSTAHGNRRMKHRWNEAVTRWNRFKGLHLLPKALPYVVKPIVVGLLPETVLKALKNNR